MGAPLPAELSWDALTRLCGFRESLRTRAPRAALLYAALLVAAFAGPAVAGTPGPPSADPLAGRSFYVMPGSPAALEVEQLRASGRDADAVAMARIADAPTATWLAGQPGVLARVSALTARAAAAGRSALLVLYDIPGRDCGGYSAGGAPSAAAYERWITAVARGIGDRAATVIVEPDAIPQLLTGGCVGAQMASERLTLLHYALRMLRAQRHVTTYLDAGNPGWITPPSRLVPSLRAAGISLASGFALNVANFYTTSAVLSYGEALSNALGGTHFVIDTSRNGNGPPPRAQVGGPWWCNPPGRALGQAPTTNTGQPRVDAYLWIKQPGASDGQCHPGDPPAGGWMPQFALSLALASAHGG